MDCTKSQSICKEFEIQGYPTIKYFSFGKFVSDYEKERTVKGLWEERLRKREMEFRKKDSLNS